MKNLYNTRVNAYGGRAGKVKSEDGILELDLALVLLHELHHPPLEVRVILGHHVKMPHQQLLRQRWC